MITDDASFSQLYATSGAWSLIYYVLTVIALWTVFRKAGIPGWTAIVPILNIYFLLKVAGRSGWWLLLFLIPIVNLIVAIVVAFDVAKRFGKGGGFAFFLLFLFPFIGYLIIGLGSAQYRAIGR